MRICSVDFIIHWHIQKCFGGGAFYSLACTGSFDMSWMTEIVLERPYIVFYTIFLNMQLHSSKFSPLPDMLLIIGLDFEVNIHWLCSMLQYIEWPSAMSYNEEGITTPDSKHQAVQIGTVGSSVLYKRDVGFSQLSCWYRVSKIFHWLKSLCYLLYFKVKYF